MDGKIPLCPPPFLCWLLCSLDCFKFSISPISSGIVPLSLFSANERTNISCCNSICEHELYQNICSLIINARKCRFNFNFWFAKTLCAFIYDFIIFAFQLIPNDLSQIEDDQTDSSLRSEIWLLLNHGKPPLNVYTTVINISFTIIFQ